VPQITIFSIPFVAAVPTEYLETSQWLH